MRIKLQFANRDMQRKTPIMIFVGVRERGGEGTQVYGGGAKWRGHPFRSGGVRADIKLFSKPQHFSKFVTLLV